MLSSARPPSRKPVSGASPGAFRQPSRGARSAAFPCRVPARPHMPAGGPASVSPAPLVSTRSGAGCCCLVCSGRAAGRGAVHRRRPGPAGCCATGSRSRVRPAAGPTGSLAGALRRRPDVAQHERRVDRGISEPNPYAPLGTAAVTSSNRHWGNATCRTGARGRGKLRCWLPWARW